MNPIRNTENITQTETNLNKEKKDEISNKADEVDLSIVIPIYNEQENIKILHNELNKTVKTLNLTYEIIFIDDGSSDKSFEKMKEEAKKNNAIKIIKFARNFGQTAALEAGFQNSKGTIVIPMDGDLQNDPADIPLLLQKIDEGYDVVSGWRKKRQDKFFTKTLPSKIANAIIAKITKIHLHDYGCTLKAYKKEFLNQTRLYGEMHRFIPVYAAWHGAKVTEIVVNHNPRKFGKTKYNLSKTLRVILDIITVKFLISYLNRPMHFFGGAGLFTLFLGFLSGAASIYLKIFYELHLNRSPLLLLAVFLFIVGIMFILMGLLAEIIIRTYYESQKKESYLIKEKVNF